MKRSRKSNRRSDKITVPSLWLIQYLVHQKMLLLQPSAFLKSPSTVKLNPDLSTFSSISGLNPISGRSFTGAVSFSGSSLSPGGSRTDNRCSELLFPLLAVSTQSDPGADPEVPRSEPSGSRSKESDGDGSFPSIRPRKPKRGRKSEADMVEDYIRSSLERTLETMREQDPQVFENNEHVIKPRAEDESDDDDDDDDESDGDGDERGKKIVVEEEDPNWPLDADIGWGIRASEYFEKHPIRNVVGEDGFEIDWEGEIDDNWVKEINCLEWESFAFHPSPLIVLVFERYNRASHNWKTLKELEKAIKVYWSAKDRLPPRAVKLDINIERDMAYALKVRDCPQILFLRGNRILYREKEFRTCDELVQMIAHFYYKAKRPSCINGANICAPY